RPVHDPRRRLAAGSRLVRTTKQRLPLAAQIALVVVGVLVLGAAAYFGLVRPKKAEAARLQKEIDTTNAQIADHDAKSLAATGRLFAIDTLSFSEAQQGFPQVSATLVVDAFVYGTQAPATATPTTTSGTTTGTTGTTTTGTTTTTTTASS